ncbi:fimbrial assembly protein [Deinococcus depolymerans]|uniref:PilN biogenesis protein dimerization domain-containing protein n=1 Tax=Deinococcus depolymerans TaxID=392408 RepID=A0ABP3MDL1_9DEIO
MVEINLLPQQYRKQSEPSAWRFATYALIPVTVAAILIPEVVTATRAGDLRKQIDSLNGEVTALTPVNREYGELTREKTELEQITSIATQLRDSKTYWTNDLAAFTAQLPAGSGVAVQSMTIKALDAAALTALQQGGVYSGKNVTREIDLTGSAASQQAVVGFLRTFENNPDFGVNFRSMQADGETGQYTFNASVGLVKPVAAATTPADPNAPATAPAAPAGNAEGGPSVN